LKITAKPEYFLAIILALTGLLASSAASADVTSTDAGTVKKRPKICLVLSGGGARGAAHVGVIKVLEELRIPIDCIAGNSMGALVGAAYASGNDVTDLEKLIDGLSTDLLFRDSPPRSEIQIRRKMEDRSLLFSPEIGINSLGGDVFPRGIVSGVQIENVFRRITARGYRDFDKLPIPYRAVATNLVTGQEVVFDKGELAAVMRASMSVPVAIAPTVVDGKLLVDGMLVDNMPVDVARSMGADIIIAVNVGTPLKTRQELGSILGVAGQMLSILTEQNVEAAKAALRPTDILISPDLGNFSTGDFDNLSAIVPTGEAAARKMTDQLSKLSLSPEEYALYRKGIPELAPPDLRPVDEIRFNKMKNVNPEYALSLMNTEPGKPLDQRVLDQDMRRIYGTGDFEHVGYNISDDQGQHILTVNAEEKSWGPNYVRFGLGLNSDFKGDSNFNVQVRHRKTWLDSLGAELTTDFQIGQTNMVRSEFFQPLDNGHHFFVAPSVSYKQ
jgi:NTE family protein